MEINLDNLGGVLPEVKAMVIDIMNYAKNNGYCNLWVGQGYNPNSRPEHSSRLAVDIIYSPSVGTLPTEQQLNNGIAVAQYAIGKYGNCMKWILCNQMAWNPVRGAWRLMEDRGSVSANHKDHFHIFIDSGKIGQLRDVAGAIPNNPVVEAPVVVHKLPRVDEDGIFGNKTLAGLQRLCGAQLVDISSVYSSPVWRRLPEEAFPGNTIPKLQEHLNRRGHSLTVDGIAGPRTIAAMQMEFNQAATRGVSLTVDGVCGSKTILGMQKYINWWTGN